MFLSKIEAPRRYGQIWVPWGCVLAAPQKVVDAGGSSKDVLGCSGDTLGFSGDAVVTLWALWGRSGMVWGRSGDTLGRSGDALGTFWIALGTLWRRAWDALGMYALSGTVSGEGLGNCKLLVFLQDSFD